MKPIIGIVGRCIKSNNKNIIQVDEEYRLAIVKSGGIPIIILPPNDSKYDDSNKTVVSKLTKNEKEEITKILSICNGFLMIGGTRWYEFDELICNFAIDNNLPILGICLGMQILANMDNFCGSINSDRTVKNDTFINHYNKYQKYVHNINIIPSKLKQILKKDTFMVNSRHNYHVLPKKYFKVSAISEDCIIEAIEIEKHKFAIGVQWHPESMIHYEPIMLKIFEAFIESTCE